MSTPFTFIERLIRSLRWRYRPVLLLLLLGATPALAAQSSLKTLLMPGKLVHGHAQLEADCNQCHVSFAKEAQDKLCIDCHKPIAADIAASTGFHGRISPGATPACRQCHTDHKGRDADIVGLDRDTFNHAKTDFALSGAHTSVGCSSCHRSDKPFRDAPQACIGCHEKDDRHRGALGKQCESCHTSNSWNDTRFDHAKTDFALRGAHQKVTCASCHPAERFKNTPQRCVSCHAINDVHKGQNGSECKSCHNETAWKKVSFDHNRDTHFPLRSAHARVECISCHRAGKFDVKLGTACVDCHRGDDIHKGRNGSECQQCHGEADWKTPKFDHARDAGFALKGLHDGLACNSCHRGNVREKVANTCVGCHRSDDVHKGQQGEQCQQCHSEEGWSKQIAFDHALVKFPLVGLHETLPCASCHVDRAFAQTPRECRDCHGADDRHQGALGTQCGQCHNPSGWNYWEFDHAARTHFALDGAHADLGCASCHRQPPAIVKLRRDCHSCHARDDRHDGRFGRNCAQCHNTKRFDDTGIMQR